MEKERKGKWREGELLRSTLKNARETLLLRRKERARFRPYAVNDRRADDFSRVENDAANPRPPPCVKNMDGAVSSLDHGGIGVFARTVFKNGDCAPVESVVAHGDVEHIASARRDVRVIVNEEESSVLERNGVDSAIGVRQRGRFKLAPRPPGIFRPRLKNRRGAVPSAWSRPSL